MNTLDRYKFFRAFNLTLCMMYEYLICLHYVHTYNFIVLHINGNQAKIKIETDSRVPFKEYIWNLTKRCLKDNSYAASAKIFRLRNECLFSEQNYYARFCIRTFFGAVGTYIFILWKGIHTTNCYFGLCLSINIDNNY